MIRVALACVLLIGCASRHIEAASPPVAIRQSAPPPPVTEPPTTKPTVGKQRAATPIEKRVIAGLANTAESVRNLRFNAPVTVEVEDEVAIAASLLEQVKAEDIARAKAIYTALGLLPRDIDLKKLLDEVLSEQVVGYYDPETHRLVVRDDVMAGLQGARVAPAQLEETKFVLVHELVHALQDQRLGLGASHDVERDSDPENAFRSVVEGDATLAMMAHALRGQGLPLSLLTNDVSNLDAVIDTDALVSGQKLTDAPAILRVTLVAPYLRGLQLAATVHKHGGWPAVDRLHRDPPTTTEQVLHPDKYLRREKPTPITLPRFGRLDRAGYKTLQEDTLGELELAVYLGQRLAGEYNAAAAAGWDGDRLRVYTLGDKRAVVWFTVWDTVRDARQAARAAQQVSPKNQNARVVRRGRAVLVVREVPLTFHAEIMAAFAKMSEALVSEPAVGYEQRP